MTRYLLDANHLGQAVGKSPAFRNRIGEQHILGHRFGTVLPCVFEVEAGFDGMTGLHNARSCMADLRRFVRVWPLELRQAEEFGRAYNEARRNGRALSFPDLVQVVIARELVCAVLTTDRDFEAFPDIKTENWLAQRTGQEST